NRWEAQRTAGVAGFKAGAYQVLVATDIAARGIDVTRLGHVVNFDVPAAAEDYVHRIGRTGRAEMTGTAFTFVSPEEEDSLRSIERGIGRRLPWATVAGVAYTARQTSLDVPRAERIAAIRQRKAQERKRARVNAARRAAAQRGDGNAPALAGSHKRRPGRSRGRRWGR